MTNAKQIAEKRNTQTEFKNLQEQASNIATILRDANSYEDFFNDLFEHLKVLNEHIQIKQTEA